MFQLGQFNIGVPINEGRNGYVNVGVDLNAIAGLFRTPVGRAIEALENAQEPLSTRYINAMYYVTNAPNDREREVAQRYLDRLSDAIDSQGGVPFPVGAVMSGDERYQPPGWPQFQHAGAVFNPADGNARTRMTSGEAAGEFVVALDTIDTRRGILPDDQVRARISAAGVSIAEPAPIQTQVRPGGLTTGDGDAPAAASAAAEPAPTVTVSGSPPAYAFTGLDEAQQGAAREVFAAITGADAADKTPEQLATDVRAIIARDPSFAELADLRVNSAAGQNQTIDQFLGNTQVQGALHITPAHVAALTPVIAEARQAAHTTPFVPNPALGTLDLETVIAKPLNVAVAELLTAPTITTDADDNGPGAAAPVLGVQRISGVFQAMTNSIEAAQERPLIEADQTRAREAIVQAAQQRPLAAGETREAIVQAAQEHTLTEEEIRGVVVQDARTQALGVFTTALRNPQIAGNIAHIYQTANESERAIIDAALEGPDGLVTALGDPMGTRLQEQVDALQADAERRRAQVEGREPTPGGDGGMNFFQGLILMIVELVGRETPFGQQLLGMVDPEHRAPRTAAADTAPEAPAQGTDAPDIVVTATRAPDAPETDVGVSAEILRAYDPDSYAAILGDVRASNSGVDEIRIVSLAEQQYNAHLETVALQLDGGEAAIRADGIIDREERAFIESKRPDFDRLLADNAVTRDAALQTASADIASVGDLAVVDNSGQRRETGVVLAQG